MEAAINETAGELGGSTLEEEEGVQYVTIRIPVRRIDKMPTVSEQVAKWSPRQARAQRLVYDGMAYAGEGSRGSRAYTIGTTAPLWHATAWVLDKIADAYGMDPSGRDTLA